MRRIALFLLTNIAVLLLLSIVCSLLGIDQWAARRGLGGMTGLLAYAAVFGMGGAFISLAMSKWMAKMSTGARVIEQPQNEAERWLVDTVRRHAQNAGIGMPEVAICAWRRTVSSSQRSVSFAGCSITRAPVDIFAIHLDMASEMKAPPMPNTAA